MKRALSGVCVLGFGLALGAFSSSVTAAAYDPNPDHVLKLPSDYPRASQPMPTSYFAARQPQAAQPQVVAQAPAPKPVTVRDYRMRAVTGESPLKQQEAAGTWHQANPAVVAPDHKLVPRTQTAVDVGMQFSHLHYEEPEIDVTLDGLKYGFTASGTKVVHQDYFVRGEVRGALGDDDYKGSGTSKDLPGYLIDLRGVAGGDFPLGDRYVISPYVGVGYRHLFNDSRGVTSTGYYGYRRYSNYFFAPVGTTARMGLNDGSRLSMLIELDPLLWGSQTTNLHDVDPVLPNVHNKQNDGFGVRGEFMYEAQHSYLHTHRHNHRNFRKTIENKPLFEKKLPYLLEDISQF